MSRLITSIAIVLTLAACKSSPDKPVATPPVDQAEQAPAGDDGAKAPTDPAKSTREPVVVTDADAEHRVAPNGKGEVIKFVTGEEAFLGKLSMAPGGAVPLHRDATEEYIYILEGSGVMTIDGKDYDVGPNTAIYMPSGAEVSFQNGDEKLVALQVFAGPEPSSKYDAWTAK